MRIPIFMDVFQESQLVGTAFPVIRLFAGQRLIECRRYCPADSIILSLFCGFLLFVLITWEIPGLYLELAT